jgi:hypothetical protein
MSGPDIDSPEDLKQGYANCVAIHDAVAKIAEARDMDLVKVTEALTFILKVSILDPHPCTKDGERVEKLPTEHRDEQIALMAAAINTLAHALKEYIDIAGAEESRAGARLN